MGNETRLIHALEALASDAAARPLPSKNLTGAAVSGNLEEVRAFIEGGADLSERSIGFASPLAAAAGRGHLEVVRYLVAKGADVDPKDGAFPLLAFAISNHHLDVVEFTLKAGAPVARYRNHFRLAAQNEVWDMVDAMLAAGADPSWLSPSERERLAAFVAMENPRTPDYRARIRDEQARQLEAARVNPVRGLLNETERARIEAEAVALVEAEPALATSKSENGTPLLALAVSCGAGDLARAMLGRGASPNFAGSAESPLARACSRSDIELVGALLGAGADPNFESEGSPHPVLAAAIAGSLACIEALLSRGGKPRARDLKTAIDQAGGPAAARIVARLELLQTKAAAKKRRDLQAAAAETKRAQEEKPDPARLERARGDVADLGDSIEGKVFACSGVFETLAQSDIQMSVEVRGGVFKPGVTGKTQVLVAGAKAGTKLDKAREFGIRVLDEAQFRAWLERIPITEEMKRRYLG